MTKALDFCFQENKAITTLARPRSMQMIFSPKNTHLVTWKQYEVSDEIPENTPNIEIWRIDAGEKVEALFLLYFLKIFTHIQKNSSEHIFLFI